jgi:tRNA A-37 threonylcarbamoyl transferase component Bud32
MAFVEINPKYQDFLREHGLVRADQFLRLPAVVISGHPDRHVAQVRLGRGPWAVAAYLKREHRVRWRDRLANAWAGFGFVSKALREARLLQALGPAGVPCPEWVAVGEDEDGRAFLLVRELAACLDLRVFLRQRRPAPPRERYRFARRLGEAVARLHAAGFDHPDLYGKHVLVDPHTEEIRFLDWQRSRRRPAGWRDLAALHATLADDLARPRERLACLAAYLRAVGGHRRELRQAVRGICRRAVALLRRRHVREQHQPPLPTGTQNLIWLDGEALCMTRAFWASCRGDVPGWLATPAPERTRLVSSAVALPDGGPGLLVRRRAVRPFGRLRGRRPVSPELRQAGLLFRLQRYGIPTPELLAVGQRETGPGWLDSFLLLRPLPDTMPLAEWLSEHDGRARLFREGAALLRRLHEAGCHFLADDGPCPFQVQVRSGAMPALVLGSASGIATCRRVGPSLARRDVALLRREFARARPAEAAAAPRAGGCLLGQQP